MRLVAEGGMGLVYEATHARLAGRYAIKVLPQKWSKDPEAMARFDREARITSSLQHPNIVQIIDFNTAADGTEYLVMEYLQGETLAARLARVGPMALDNVAAIIEQIASGLAAAHAHGIVHRDLKPDNIFLMQVEGRDGEWAKILDFGISKVSDASLGTIDPVNKTLIGTPQYMAPEQCEGHTKDIGAAADQFALAAITYEMLTGRRPFSGETLGEVLFRVLHAEPPPMNLDPEVEAIVRRGLAKSIRRRYPSVAAFAEALRAAAGARVHRQTGDRSEVSGSHSYAVGQIDRLSGQAPLRRRHRATVVAVAAVITVATAFIVRTARTKQATDAPAAAAAAHRAPAVPSGSADLGPPTRPPGADLERVDPASIAAATRADPDLSPAPREEELAAIVVPMGDGDGRRARAGTDLTAARTPAPRGSSLTARPTAARSTTPAAARTPKMVARASAPARRPSDQLTTSEPPPFVPAPTDDDAILPLDENFSNR